MKGVTICGGALVAVLVVVLAGNQRAVEQHVAAAAPAASTSPTASTDAVHQGYLYGRVTTDNGAAYMGRLRFGRDEEAFWGSYFNGVKHENPWATQPPIAELMNKRRPFTIFGLEIQLGEPQSDLARPFMARFGDIARIEARGRDVRVTLKSGTVFDINWNAANDFDDGVRVWDDRKGVVDLASWAGGVPPSSRVRIRTIELLPTARLDAAPGRLHGTVRTRHGDFTGFIEWDRQVSVGADEVDGRSADGPIRLRFDTIRSIARRSSDSSLVTLRDGREIVLPGTREGGDGNRGVYVDDARYGRVLVSWAASSASISVRLAAGPLTPISHRDTRSRELLPPVPVSVSPGGSSTTSMRARPPRRSMRRLGCGLHHPARPDRLDRARRRQGDAPWRRGAAARSRWGFGRRTCRHPDLRRRPRAP